MALTDYENMNLSEFPGIWTCYLRRLLLQLGRYPSMGANRSRSAHQVCHSFPEQTANISTLLLRPPFP
ncbi:hypothetical protein I7I50_12089 [Histoplasma capsulatum G186AR]|uniref:Uncharacterized protein n=1 Tax=Ajellomyces capsulatus TaxID=5037 RepID=A0A8H8CS42_AJECA|nr:hypothetical protein I7I52_11599 [Histoplasma capsulatum]QSS70454.1 hypothetical protein I7I50_12089 [Histoplasma capsulatum G186AR]